MDYGIRENLLHLEKNSYAQENHLPKDLSNYIDCSSGINPYGCSNEVKERIKSLNWEIVNGYPESSKELKQSIIEYWQEFADLQNDNILLGDGSIEIIYKINKLFLDEKSKVLGYSPQFTDYIDDVNSYGGKYECYLLNLQNRFKFDYQLFLDRMNKDYKLFYLDNPNNPTGQIIDCKEIEQVLKKAQDLNKPVIIDEAYGDFMDRGQSAISLINQYDNLFVIRTFSKGLGLAGLRAGYLVTSKKFAGYYNLVSNPFEMNGIARYLALYAMEDKNFLKNTKERIKNDKKKLMESLNKFTPLETDLMVPIMTIKHPDSHVDLEEFLRKQGILSVSGAGFIGLDKSYARVRMNENIELLINRFKDIETQMK
ncbi:MAG: pyridoxal phosphate-dependent aminotransferase [Bacillota bacterium]